MQLNVVYCELNLFLLLAALFTLFFSSTDSITSHDCCSGGAGARGTRGQMTGRGAPRGAGRGTGPAARGRGAAASASMLPPAPQSYGTEAYEYVRCSNSFSVYVAV